MQWLLQAAGQLYRVGQEVLVGREREQALAEPLQPVCAAGCGLVGGDLALAGSVAQGRGGLEADQLGGQQFRCPASSAMASSDPDSSR